MVNNFRDRVGNSHKAKILLVDDNEVLREINASLLEDMGIKVQQTGNFDDGLIRIQTNSFDLILLDLNLTNDTSKQEGLELAKARAGTRNEDTTTYVISGLADDPNLLAQAERAKVTPLFKGSYRLTDVVATALAKIGLQVA